MVTVRRRLLEVEVCRDRVLNCRPPARLFTVTHPAPHVCCTRQNPCNTLVAHVVVGGTVSQVALGAVVAMVEEVEAVAVALQVRQRPPGRRPSLRAAMMTRSVVKTARAPPAEAPKAVEVTRCHL